MSLLTVQQVAKTIGISDTLVYQWIETKELPHYRLGGEGKRGKILIDDTDLQAFIARKRVMPGQSPTPAPAPSRPNSAIKLKHVHLRTG